MSNETPATDRPATFGDVFASREYRYIFGAAVLSWFGDYLAKAAVTALVFEQSRSVLLSAAAFALSYLPWVIGGPLLATIAERLPFRSVMVVCDVLRAGVMCLAALPSLPIPILLMLLFGTALLNPPFQAARSAALPQILTGDRYVVGLSVQNSSSQLAQLGGYLAGGAIAPFHPRLALLINAATFALSGIVIRYGMADRRPLGITAERKHLAVETADGFRMVFGTRVLRAIALIVFSSMLFAIVPEGLAAAWAATLTEDAVTQGWFQGTIMIAQPLGYLVGGLLIGRMVRPEVRRRLIRPFTVLAPLALVPALISPPIGVLALMAGVCGFAVAGLLPAANGLFVQVLPAGYRARAFGVMQGGMQLVQGGAVLVTGLLADRFEIPLVVGVWSLAGVLVMLLMALRWPTEAEFAQAIEGARVNGGAGVDHEGTPGPSQPTTGRGGPIEAPA